MAWSIRHVTIVGVGLLGGSVAWGIRRQYPSAHIAGVGRRQSSLDEALALGAIDSAHLDPAQCVRKSDLVILATPVGAFGAYLRATAPLLKRSALVTDVGSTKASVVRQAERIFRSLGRGQADCPFVGSHPMAGSERKGIRHARADLLVNATCVVTPSAHTPEKRTTAIESFWQRLGMRVVRLGPVEHDNAVAVISHLPHALACLLMMLPTPRQLQLAASGFADMTRLAGGDVEMWRDIFLTNPKAVLAAIDAFDESLMHLRDVIETGDVAEIETFLAQSKTRRDDAVKASAARRRD